MGAVRHGRCGGRRPRADLRVAGPWSSGQGISPTKRQSTTGRAVESGVLRALDLGVQDDDLRRAGRPDVVYLDRARQRVALSDRTQVVAVLPDEDSHQVRHRPDDLRQRYADGVASVDQPARSPEASSR